MKSSDASPSSPSSAAPRGGIARRRALADHAPEPEAHLELPLLLAPPSAQQDARRTARAELADVAPSLSSEVAALLFGPPLDDVLAADPGREEAVVARARRLAERAYPRDAVSDRAADATVDHAARDELHRTLLACYQTHVRLPHHETAENQLHPFTCRLLATLERAWERDLLARARRTARRLGTALDASALPADPDAFVEWYKRVAFTHPLYEHPLHGFLSSEADRAQLERFLRLEAAGEAAFDDLVALGQVGTRGEVKIEMGRNYWDELGNGKSHAVHTHLFHRLTEGLKITAPEAHELSWPVLAGANVMLWSCIPRRNAFRAQGTLGAVELLAPQRCTRLVTGALRVGIPKKVMSYYAAHAIIDVGHAEGWLDHVVRPQVAAVPASRVGIAEGLIARADASLDYFDYSYAELTR
ncbi:iron-containing redox enzyme family protein [Roseisolibacter sp. H3M3-2]|uniref:iron-containing redox enzyme family protein n=1 Tax=Roseisolibacter sp. H3M3-2 TaxID=3031323 RepID=UPI0023DC94B4|nr:iron-containing redox enzyme family protein [Roseisolibacter sp. H3M3-2]MDF1504791.1 iron-containing redox enzyme family protein [Roseisolibacter sp. H3M3-2]